MNKASLLSRRLRRSSVALAVGLLVGSGAWAQSSEGSVYGRAKSGTPVSITNVDTGVSRQVQPDADGSFNFSKLAPGRYRVASAGVTKEVAVAIGSGTEVVLIDEERVQVVGSRTRSLIDFSSVESNSVFTQSQIRNLPVARSVDAVALLAPGTVQGDDFADRLKLPSFGGASVAENGYFINGFDVTNIRNFLSYADLPFDAVDQQQVKNGGYGAEYGRSLGGVVSLVTKRGTNEWKGGVAYYTEPRSLRSEGQNVADKEIGREGTFSLFQKHDTQSNNSVTAYAGGPLIKDKLWVFGIIEGHDDRYIDFKQTQSTIESNTKPNGMIKVDWALTDRHLFEFTGIENKKRLRFSDYTNAVQYSTSHDGAPKLSERTQGGNVLIGKYTGYLTDDLTISALFGRVKDQARKTTGARLDGQDCPVVLEVDTSEIGCWSPPFPGLPVRDLNAPAEDVDTRKGARFDLEYTLGAHTIKSGIDLQRFASSEAGGSTFSGQIYYRYFTSPTGAVNGVANAVAPGAQYVRGREIFSTTGTYNVDNSAFYIEDTWKISKRLSVYGGLRWESFNNKNGEGISFVEAKNLMAPRTGFSWDVNGDASLRIYGNAGRYYIPVASNTNIRATRGEIFETRFYTFNGRDPRTQAPLSLSPQVGPALINGDGTLPNPGTIADTKLKPMNQDEFILGFQKAVSKQWVFGAKATYRKVNDGMDDFCGHYPMENWAADNGYTNFSSDSLASCILMNPGRDVNLKMDLNDDGNLTAVTIPASYFGLAKYSRTYKALELSVERPFDGKWGFQGSYVLSSSKGTAEGYVQSNLDQDDAGVTQDFDFGSFTDGAKGYLPNDRRHVFKLFGNVAITDEFRVGLNVTLASGRPLSCIGFVPNTVPDIAESITYTSASSYYCVTDANTQVLVRRGSAGRTPWTRQLDLQFAYTPNWAKGKLTLQADVFNILNSQKVTEVNEVRDFGRQDSNAPPFRQSLNYLSPTSFQQPRYVRLAARYEF